MRTNAVINGRSLSIARLAKHVILKLCKPVAICLIVSHSSVTYVASSTSRKGLKRSKWVEWLNVYAAFQDIMKTYPADFSLFLHDDVNKWKHFPRYWPFVRGIHQSPVKMPAANRRQFQQHVIEMNHIGLKKINKGYYIYIYIGNVYFVRFSRHTICFKQLAPQVARATKTRMLPDERITDITWLCRRFTISVLEISYKFVFYHELKLLGFIIASIGTFMKHRELLYGIKRPLWLCKHCSDR